MKKKRIRTIAGMLLLTGLFFGCAGSQRLSDHFDEAEVKAAAEEVIQTLNSKEVEALVEEQWNTVMKNAVDADMLKEQIVPIVEELGEFEGFDKEAVTGAKDPDTEQEFAVAVIKVKYEKRKAQFTISFDEDMKVAGFFIK